MRTKLLLRSTALFYLALLVALPVGMVLWRAFEHGVMPFWQAMTEPDALRAIQLSLLIVLVVIPANTIFGILCAIVLVRHEFRGKALLNACIDLPMGVSPVVVGLSLIIVYGGQGWFGRWLIEHGIRVIFATPGMILATIFVSLPFVVREVVPVLREIGIEQEQAASTLGASPLQIFMHVTLPAIRSGVGFGVVLTMARAIGEFGAVSVVSGKIVGQTATMTLYVEERFQQFDLTAAYAMSVAMALLALAVLVVMNLLGGVRKREG